MEKFNKYKNVMNIYCVLVFCVIRAFVFVMLTY